MRPCYEKDEEDCHEDCEANSGRRGRSYSDEGSDYGPSTPPQTGQPQEDCHEECVWNRVDEDWPDCDDGLVQGLF